MSRSRRLVLPLVLIAAVLAAAVPIVGLAAPNDPVLPDLVADRPANATVAPYTYPSGTQALLLRFDGYVHNIGPGPFEIRAGSRSGTVMTNTRQWVRTEGGAMVESPPPPGPPSVIFETDDAHNHWHLREIARYSLWNFAKTAEVAPAMKTGFCLVDSERIETSGPAGAVYTVGGNNFCGQGEPTRSSLTMGVSAGWRDLYHKNLAFQWVDISDVRPGQYWVAADIDANNVVRETNESNNTRNYASAASTVPGYVATAVNAGTLPFGQASTITLAAQSFGTPGSRRFRIESLPLHGALRSGTTTLGVGAVVVGPDITYTPASGYTGPDTFTFSALDSTSAFPRTPAAAAVSLTVGEQPAEAQVAISGAPSSLDIGSSAQLSATVINGPPGVTWSVNGVTGGNATVGTISAAGLYQAPAAVPAGGQVTVRATSTSVPAAFAEVTIAIVDPGDPDPAPEPAPNAVRNPSFETDLSGWGGWQSTRTRVQLADAPDGAWVAKVARSSGSSFTLDDSPESVLSAVGGATYTARAWVKAGSPSAVGKSVRIALREGTPGPTGVFLRTVNGPSVTLTNAFREVTAQISGHAAGNELEVMVVQPSGAVAGDAFYVDKVSFSTGTAPPPPPPPPPNQPPSPGFTVTDLTPDIGQSVTFTDSSTDTDGTIASRAWDLDGDGQYDDGTGTTAARSYASAGPVTVGLRVTDDDGAPATTSQVVTVQAATPTNQPPAASFTVNPSSPQVGQSVTFTDTSTDTDGTIASRAWDLDNDGQFDDGTGTTATRSFPAAGDQTVRLQVTDDDGAPATTSRVVSVQAAAPTNQPPTPSFSVTDLTPDIGQSVTFTDTSTDTDGTIASRAWDLDNDGQYDDGTGVTAARSFPAAGDATVRLQVTDDDGAPATTSRVLTVQSGPPPPPPPGSNLIRNPSFETSLTSWWRYQATLTREQLAGAPDGSWVARVTRSTGNAFTIDDDPETVSAAVITGPYVARAWVRAATSSSVGKVVRINLREATPGPTGSYIRTIQGPTVTLTNTFQEITAQMTVQAAGNEIDIYISQASAVTGNAFFVDKVSLTPPA